MFVFRLLLLLKTNTHQFISSKKYRVFRMRFTCLIFRSLQIGNRHCSAHRQNPGLLVLEKPIFKSVILKGFWFSR